MNRPLLVEHTSLHRNVRIMKLYGKILYLLTIVMFFFVGISQAVGMGPVTMRPLSDFLEAQGSTSDFFPPVPDYVGWVNAVDPETGFPTTFALIDYTGLANQYLSNECSIDLGTTVSGTVIQRELTDGSGKAEITVNLHTKNAQGFALLVKDIIDHGFDGAPAKFGNKTLDVCEGAQAAVGNTHLSVKFNIKEAGDSLPDLVDLINNNPEVNQPISVVFSATIFNDENQLLNVHQTVAPSLPTYTSEVVEIRGRPEE